MRQHIKKLGRLNTVILITLITIFSSILLTYFISYLKQDYSNLSFSILLAIVIPLIVTSLVSWPFVNLIIRIDELESEMRKLATYDALTGLLTRRAFFNDASNFVNFAERKQMPLSLIILDFDNFKDINDSYGHPAGDKVLKHFGKSIKSIIRKSDLVGRIGGEEFSLLLPDTSEDTAIEFSERLHSIVRKSVINHSQSTIRYTISIGLISLIPGKKDSIESIIKNADKSLYLAKEKGRNRTEVFNKTGADAVLPVNLD